MKLEFSANNVRIIIRIYFNFIIVNLTNTSFTISIMTRYTVAVSCRFASIGNVTKSIIAGIIYLL